MTLLRTMLSVCAALSFLLLSASGARPQHLEYEIYEHSGHYIGPPAASYSGYGYGYWDPHYPYPYSDASVVVAGPSFIVDYGHSSGLGWPSGLGWQGGHAYAHGSGHNGSHHGLPHSGGHHGGNRRHQGGHH